MNLYKAKRRSLKKGLPILLADYRDIGKVVVALSNYAELLIDRFWPGPLPLILRKREDLPHSLSPNDGIGVRIPDNDIARDFIRASGGAIASSSANIAGKAPARDANEAGAALAKHIAAIIDGGRVGDGRPSTVVDCREDPPLILRRGPISPEQILFSSNIHP
jgi:L-threonylcarbamoyladenylate synthase